MRTIVISDATRQLLEADALCRCMSGGRQLRDSSWEIEIDDALAFALDQLACDPDEAVRLVCTQQMGHA